MTIKKRTISYGIFFFLMISLVWGQGARNGTAGASQLLVPQGARYLSGGGAVASADGIEAAYWNPAGLVRSANNIDAIFANRTYIADMSINFFGAVAKFGSLGSIALTGRVFDIGSIDVTDVFNPDGTGAQFTPSYFVVGLGYSRQVSDRTTMGINMNYLNESFTRVGASGLTLDIGVQYTTFLNIDGLDVGVALRNFGNPMRYDGSALWVSANASGSDRQTEWYKVQAGSFDMPFIMDIGGIYNFGPVDVGVTYNVNYFAQDNISLLGQYNVGKIATLRAGYLMDTETVSIPDNTSTTTVDESTIKFENIFSGASFGGSLNLKELIGTNLSVDYTMFLTRTFSNNQVIALRMGF